MTMKRSRGKIIAAARSIAARTPQGRIDALHDEHRRLVGKKMEQPLERRELARLGLVRWELERIEDAELGPTLDFWERLADEQKRLSEEVMAFASEVKKASRPARAPKNRR
jgi:hypothetical protein